MSSNESRVVWSTDWQPPALSALNFNPDDEVLCQAAGAWKAINVGSFQHQQNFITADYVLAYLRAILPSNIMQPNDYTLLHWYNDRIVVDMDETTRMPTHGSLLETLSDFPLEYCSADVCKNLDWVGDPDVSGRGMLITYYIAAALVTIYACALALSRSSILKGRYPASSKRAWLLSGFEESVSTFLDGTLIFAVSMLAAACFRLSQAFFQEAGASNGHWMIYASIGSIYMSTFSSLLPLLLQLVARDVRRHWLRLLLWTLILFLGIANEILYDCFFAKVKAYQLKDLIEAIWLSYCNPNALLAHGLLPTLRLAQILLVLNALYYVVYRSCRGKTANTKRWAKLKAFWQGAKPYIQSLNAAICCLLMWSILGVFHYYRDLVNDAAGDDNQNSDWTFGQVLSVATWLPVLVEFATVLKYGPEEGLGKKISRNYTVVSNTAPVYNEKDMQYSRVETGFTSTEHI
ncbi:hypothetical protein F5Y13DRAFT_153763 [Hypoxylon sp. FL1857]|nr:hypothetical protein F5Y13DRAFT_153763 [Hypoxylon sp. FL1857]